MALLHEKHLYLGTDQDLRLSDQSLVETQADRVFEKFGGPGKIANILQLVAEPRNRVTIYKWNYPRSKGGTGGVIPTTAWPDLFEAARFAGFEITADLLDPRPRSRLPMNIKRRA